MDSVDIFIEVITLASRKYSFIDPSDFLLFELVTKHSPH